MNDYGPSWITGIIEIKPTLSKNVQIYSEQWSYESNGDLFTYLYSAFKE